MDKDVPLPQKTCEPIPPEQDPGREEYWRAWAKTPEAKKEYQNPDAMVDSLLNSAMISKAGSMKPTT